MRAELPTFVNRLTTEDAVLVTVDSVQGSVPREPGAWMAVFSSGSIGTIGGGHLEWDALQQARAHLSDPGGQGALWRQRTVLGPSLGQCCGGVVELKFEHVSAVDAERLLHALQPSLASLALFGAGHVGHAIVHALEPLPFAVRWIDSRDDGLTAEAPPGVSIEHSDPVHFAVRELAPGSSVLIMSFSHAEDLDIVAACLQRMRQHADLPFVGLIGSQTKWATFRRRLRERGYTEAELSRITSPIGLPGIQGKTPAVIAASVVAQLLMTIGA